MNENVEAVYNNMKSMGKLHFEFKKFPSFDHLRKLVPANCLVGMHEVIPGIIDQTNLYYYFPVPRANKAQQYLSDNVKVELPKTVYLYNMALMVNH